VATTTRGGADIKVWEVATGRAAVTIPCRPARAAFSPDSRWLAVSDLVQTLRLWHVGSWLPGRVFEGDKPGNFAFSRDGRLLAFGTPEGVRLVVPDTGRRLAMLAPPPDASPGVAWLAFSPDAGQVAVSAGDSTVLLWDLRLVRERLVGLGLDWDWPPLPASDPSAAGARSGLVQVEHDRVTSPPR
jgi:WD40 repeat protein